MPNRPIEDMLRKRLRRHATPVDTDALWDKVEPRLPNNRPVFSFWQLLVGGIIVLAGLSAFLPDTAEKEAWAAEEPTPAVAPALLKTDPAPASAPTKPSLAPASDKETVEFPAQESAFSAPTVNSSARSTPRASTSPEEATPPLPSTTTDSPPEATTFYVRGASAFGRRPLRLVAVPFLALPRANDRVISLYERITFTPPGVLAQASPLPETPGVPEKIARQTGTATGTVQPEARVGRAGGTRAARKKATHQAKQVTAQAKRDESQAARHAKQRRASIAKTARKEQREITRQAWLFERAAAKTKAAEEKENLRAGSRQRIAEAKAEKEREKIIRDILKRNKDKYAKADREARQSMVAQREQRHLDRLTQRTQAKAERLRVRNIRMRQSAFWTFEFGATVSLPSRSVNVAGDNPDGGQVSVNGEYEKPLEAISLQGLVGHHRPGGLSLRTGIVYSRINSRVESEFVTTETGTVEAVVNIIENPDGSLHEQIGTVEVLTEIKTIERYYNSVGSTDLPILLGYRFGGTKWGLTVEAGPTFNLGSNGSAHLYDGAGNYRLVSNGHFRNRLAGRGFLATFGGSYNLSATTMLTANLRIQGFGKGGFEQPSTGYATKYTLIGVQLGYRVRF